MKVYFKPKTALGKWSIGLFVGMIVFYLLSISQLPSSVDDPSFSSLAFAIPSLLATISGAVAFFTGIISIIKSKERSVIVFIVTIIEFSWFVLIFWFASAS